jgi:DNA-binding CsgD family transcriptional regulator
MEAVSVGMMVVADDGQLLFANPVAEELLYRRAGLFMINNQLHAVVPSVDPEFQRLLLRATQATTGKTTEAGGLLRIPRQGARPISLSIYPFMAPVPSNGDRVPSALIFINDPEINRPPQRDVLAQMYRLTKAEAKLFEALLAGERLQDYADRSSLSLQTVKTQLRRLFEKTGYTRQTDLVREGLSNPLLNLTKS